VRHIAHQPLERRGVLGPQRHNEAAQRLGEQRQVVARIAGQATQIDLGAELARDAHLGQRHAQPALGAVVAGAHQPGADRPV
jgi:hypothetical protein